MEAVDRWNEGLVEPALNFQTRNIVARLSRDAAGTAEEPRRQNLAVRLHRDGEYLASNIWVEGISQSGNRIEPGHAMAGLSADIAERTAHQNLAVGMDYDRVHVAVRARVERIRQAAIGMEPRDGPALLAPDVVKIAAH